MEKIDLHMHSDISLDGQFNPGELAALYRGCGLAVPKRRKLITL